MTFQPSLPPSCLDKPVPALLVGERDFLSGYRPQIPTSPRPIHDNMPQRCFSVPTARQPDGRCCFVTSAECGLRGGALLAAASSPLCCQSAAFSHARCCCGAAVLPGDLLLPWRHHQPGALGAQSGGGGGGQGVHRLAGGRRGRLCDDPGPGQQEEAGGQQ